ncbi:MAG: hypothetical protein NXI02_31015 [Rhodobacteraceae bacterium]|nr:hypothetical protein [Paracoccaceae bacterium]
MEIEISGQLHRSVLFWSDGAEKNSYIVDPTSGGSFFSFAGDTDLNEQWEAGFLLEIDTTSNKSDELSQNGASSAMAINLGSAKFFFSRSELGSVSLGKQTEAHDHITEFDLSGTDDFAGPAVSDWNGDFLLRHSPARRNLASQFTWAVFGADDIGDGAEASVIRLDTPDERKVQASFSWGMGGVSAVALRFAESLGDFDVMGGAAFAYYADDARSPCRDDDDDLAGCGTLGGSLSVKHKPSAISFTAAYGLTVIKPSDAPGQSYWSYGKLARAWPLLRLGPTTTYAEYFHGVRNIPIELDELAVGAGGTGDVEAVTNVIGIGVMQNLEDFEIDFYLALRRYEIEAEVHGVSTAAILGQ